MAVPITAETRAVIEKEFSVPAKEMEATALIFASAVKEVQQFIEENQFPRFMQSSEAAKVSAMMTTMDQATTDEDAVDEVVPDDHDHDYDVWQEEKTLGV